MSDRGFGRRLRRAAPRPASPRAWYAAAFAASLVGLVSVLGARSEPIFISGWLIMATAALGALYVWRASRR